MRFSRCWLCTRYSAGYSWLFYVQLWFKLLFPIVVILALAITGWAALHDPPAGASRLIRLVLFSGLALNFMQVCLVSLFVFLADTYRLRWRFSPLGISLGFAISALGAEASYWVGSEFEARFETIARYAAQSVHDVIDLRRWLILAHHHGQRQALNPIQY